MNPLQPIHNPLGNPLGHLGDNPIGRIGDPSMMCLVDYFQSREAMLGVRHQTLKTFQRREVPLGALIKLNPRIVK